MSKTSIVRIVSQTTTECMKVFTEALHVLFNKLLHSIQYTSSHHISVSFTLLCLCTKLICWIDTTLASLLKFLVFLICRVLFYYSMQRYGMKSIEWCLLTSRAPHGCCFSNPGPTASSRPTNNFNGNAVVKLTV